jgi:ornithine carbamoyltransferase
MPRSLLSLESLPAGAMLEILALAKRFKAERGRHQAHPLRHQCWGLIFTKSSTRTRVSFEVGIREFGGDPIFLSAGDLQLGRGEPIKDTARVMGRMLHGAVIRTFAQSDVEDFAEYSGIPVINALTDDEHPCQILADCLALQERWGTLRGRTIAFVGDGNNVATSLAYAAAMLGANLHVASPDGYQLPDAVVQRSTHAARHGARLRLFSDPGDAVADADAVYTDTCTSMGKEAETDVRRHAFRAYQVTDDLMALAKPGAIFMHCLPAHRGEEVSAAVLEGPQSVVFDQAENRLHAQKALLAMLFE